MDVVAHYWRLIHPGKGGAADALEAFQPANSLDEQRFDRALQTCRRALDHISENAEEAGNPATRNAARTLAGALEPAIDALVNRDELRLDDPLMRETLEAVVRLDGTRPSWLVASDDIIVDPEPLTWSEALHAARPDLRGAIAATCRIDDVHCPQGFAGTGILVAERLVLTNRHVAQAICRSRDLSDPRDTAMVDFGHELSGSASRDRRAVRSVAFAAPDWIEASIDHRLTDIALLEIDEPSDDSASPLPIGGVADWCVFDQPLIAVGYPGRPGPGYGAGLLEQLFAGSYGVKRAALGTIIREPRTDPNAPHYFGHDATTLGGSSGSILISLGDGQVGAALHYGGRSTPPSANWAHPLALCLNVPDIRGRGTFEAILRAGGGVLAGDRPKPMTLKWRSK